MKTYTITVNGNVYNVTVEEGTTAGAPAAAPVQAPRAAAPAPAPATGSSSRAGGSTLHRLPLPHRQLPEHRDPFRLPLPFPERSAALRRKWDRL